MADKTKQTSMIISIVKNKKTNNFLLPTDASVRKRIILTSVFETQSTI